jgi:hypothetical protein
MLKPSTPTLTDIHGCLDAKLPNCHTAGCRTLLEGHHLLAVSHVVRSDNSFDPDKGRVPSVGVTTGIQMQRTMQVPTRRSPGRRGQKTTPSLPLPLNKALLLISLVCVIPTRGKAGRRGGVNEKKSATPARKVRGVRKVGRWESW